MAVRGARGRAWRAWHACACEFLGTTQQQAGAASSWLSRRARRAQEDPLFSLGDELQAGQRQVLRAPEDRHAR
eukprot:1400459-Prymnesium_polylepis.1